MHKLFPVYFVNLYMLRAYLGPSSGGTTVCIQQMVLIILFVLVPTRTTDSHLKRIISTICCIHTVVPPDDGPRYARNMYRWTKYTKNKLCIKLVFLYTVISRCTVKNIYMYSPLGTKVWIQAGYYKRIQHSKNKRRFAFVPLKDALNGTVKKESYISESQHGKCVHGKPVK
jgi:hypothetical protein